MMEQLTLFDYTRPMIRVDKTIRLISLFSGYDSQALALKYLGADYEHYKAIEFDEFAVKSLNAIHGTNFKARDIRAVHGEDLEITDKDTYTYLMTYSFPCTDISLAGKQKGMAKDSGTRSALLWEVERILDELKTEGSLPDILLMENVAAICNDYNRPHLRKWLGYLEDLGYTNFTMILNAADYGIPQHRERFFALSLLGEWNYKTPNPIELTTNMEDYFEDLTEEQALKQIVKSEKAMDLLVGLDNDGKLE